MTDNQQFSLHAGPIKTRFSGGQQSLLVLGLLALVAWIVWALSTRPVVTADAIVICENAKALAEKEMKLEKGDHEKLKADFKALVERTNRLEGDLGNQIRALEIEVQRKR